MFSICETKTNESLHRGYKSLFCPSTEPPNSLHYTAFIGAPPETQLSFSFDSVNTKNVNEHVQYLSLEQSNKIKVGNDSDVLEQVYTQHVGKETNLNLSKI